MPIKFFTSTDAGAPSLTGNPGSLISVLDACLVNGYGSKSSLGWSKVYGDSTTGGYRRPNGFASPTVLQVNDTFTSAAGGQRAFARVKMIESATAFDTGFNLVPPSTTLPINNDSLGLYWTKKNDWTAGAVPWTLIGDEKGFYIFLLNAYAIGTVSNNSPEVGHFGQFVPVVATDSSIDVLTGQIGSGNRSYAVTPNTSSYPSSSANTIWLLRDYNGIYIGRNSASYYSSPYFGNTNLRSPNLLHGKIPFLKTYIIDSFDVNFNTGTNCFTRGYFRNVRTLGGTATSLAQYFPVNTIQTINGKQFYVLDTTATVMLSVYPIDGEYDG